MPVFLPGSMRKEVEQRKELDMNTHLRRHYLGPARWKSVSGDIYCA